MHSIDSHYGMSATFIEQVGPFTFYECPERGDEAPLLMRDNDDWKWYQTGFWDVPTLEEIYDEITQY